MLERLTVDRHRKTIAIGALVLVLGALALQPNWLVGVMKTITRAFSACFSLDGSAEPN